MPLAELAAWLLGNPAFAERLERIVVEAAQAELPGDAVLPSRDLSRHDWNYLLLAASLLAKVDDAEPVGAACHDAALRIAQHCLAHGRDSAPPRPASGPPSAAEQASAANVLSSLANIPAIRLAIRRQLLPTDVEERLPFPVRIDWTRRNVENSVPLADDRTLTVNHFQRRLWSILDANDWVSFSAPTSAGKSFIVTQWVIDLIRRRPNAVVVYVVPTRALIGQVEAEMRILVSEAALNDVSISSLPLAGSVISERANILVLTQERLHILMNAVPTLATDALIVDEAQKLGDGHRGVLLQQVVEQVVRVAPQAKIIFGSPMTENPELLIADAPPNRSRTAFRSNEITVAQNLMWASQVPRRPRVWTVELCLPQDIVPLGTIRLAATPAATTKRLSYIAHALGERRAGNVVYVNGPADAEKVAAQLYGLRGGAAEIVDKPDVAALIDLARRTVHPQFLLTTVLRRGIAFHYGNLPLLIRTEIERLFTAGVLHYLVCTSTLIEGVNMSCRTMFVRGPTKGRGRPMSAEDFWNLAGRAGRWGREFQGNVVCVDARATEVWGPDGPPRRRRPQAIKRTADAVVAQADDLVAFVSARTPRVDAVRRPDLEFVFSYLVTQQQRHGSIRELPWVNRLDPASVARVEDVIVGSIADLRTPLTVLERNPGISPLAMDALLRRFERPDRDPVSLLPADPASNDAVEIYRNIFGRIAGELNASLGPPGRRSHALAILVTRWMRGFPIARLISDRIEYEERQGGVNIAGIIRSVLNDVEQIARFEAPRSLACYTDLLRFYLASIDRGDLAADLPDLSVMLEFGVSLPTQISLIGLGLSRTSAVSLDELITDDNLDKQGALRWLIEGLWRHAELPELVKAEIARVLAIHLPNA